MSGSSPPVATVPRFVRRKHKLKKARGFSLGELKQAGLERSQAHSMDIRTDARRSTVHVQNVAALKTFLASSTPKTTVSRLSVEAPMEESEPKSHSVSVEKKAKPRRSTRVEKRKQ